MTCQFATLLNFTTISTNYYCLHDIGQHAARRGEGRGRELEHKKCKNDLEGLRNLEEIGAKSLGSQVAAGLSPYLVNSALLLRDTARVCGEGGGGLNVLPYYCNFPIVLDKGGSYDGDNGAGK